jgi:hypothetical protein
MVKKEGREEKKEKQEGRRRKKDMANTKGKVKGRKAGRKKGGMEEWMQARSVKCMLELYTPLNIHQMFFYGN